MVPSLPIELVDAARNRNIAVFAGAGISIPAGLPSWPDLLRRFVGFGVDEGVIDEKVAEIIVSECDEDPRCRDLACAFERLEGVAGIGRGVVKKWLRRVFRNDSKPGPVHSQLARLDCPIVTTNYDLLIEGGFLGVHPLVKTWQNVGDLLPDLQEGKPFVLKAHGDVDNLGSDGERGSPILTSADYERLMRCDVYLKFLGAVFTARTVLFLGYSLGDPYILDTLSQIDRLYKPNWKRAYTVVANGSEPDFARQLGIHTVPISDWAKLTDVLGELAPATASTTAALPDSFPHNWDWKPSLKIVRDGLNAGRRGILLHGRPLYGQHVFARTVLLELSRHGYRPSGIVPLKEHYGPHEVLESAETHLDIGAGTGGLGARKDRIVRTMTDIARTSKIAVCLVCPTACDGPGARQAWSLVKELSAHANIAAVLAVGMPADQLIPGPVREDFTLVELGDYRWTDLDADDRAGIPTDELRDTLRATDLSPLMAFGLGGMEHGDVIGL